MTVYGDATVTDNAISTHTSRVGCDSSSESTFLIVSEISTHTSRVGCDGTSSGATNGNFLFLLTHPVWDVTRYIEKNELLCQFLLTHPGWDVTYGLQI